MILAHTIENYIQQIESLKQEVSKWRERAERDGLTGCLRRESFMEIIESRKKFGLLSQEMTVVIVDIDHFKKVNDTYGHQAGDDALRHSSKILRESVPEGGLVCRMGGEEFVLILPGNVEENKCFLEALRIRIATSPCRLQDSQKLQLTVSLGAVSWKTTQPLLVASAAADALLYRAKNEGRNRLAA